MFTNKFDRKKPGRATLLFLASAVAVVLGGYGNALAAPLYTIQDLGVIPGGVYSYASAVNNLGQVTGYSATPVEDLHAFFWHGGVMTDIGTKGGDAGIGASINDLGQIAGFSNKTVGGDLSGFFWNGTMHDIGALPGATESIATSINNAGRIAGWGLDNNGFEQAVIWDGTNPISIGPPGVLQIANGINDVGLVTGNTSTGHAFIWDGVNIQDLGTLGGVSSVGNAINHSGMVTGQSTIATGQGHAFLWNGTMMIDINSGAFASYGHGINSGGVIVGRVFPTAVTSYPFVWDGAMTNLNSVLVNGAGLTLEDAVSINDLGQIAANGTIAGTPHAFLLTPVNATPEPATSWMMAGGLLALLLSLCKVAKNQRLSIWATRDIGVPVFRWSAAGQMKHAFSLAAWLSLACVNLLHAQPVIRPNSVVNAASHIPPGLPNYGIAQGSMFVLKGQGVAIATDTTDANPMFLTPNSPLPTTLGGASIKITVGGVTVDAPMVHAVINALHDDLGRYEELAGIVPSSTPPGEGTITVTVNGQTSAPASITVVRSAFGIFTLSQAGTGPGIFTGRSFTVPGLSAASQFLGPGQPRADFDGNTLQAAAHPGDLLAIWGTGLGAIRGGDSTQPPAGNLDVLVRVYVGNVEADLDYQGRAACCAGIDKVVFRVPEGIQGCYVPVVVMAGGVVSNVASISISPSGPVCSDPSGFSTSELQTAKSGTDLVVADVLLNRISFNLSIPGMETLQPFQDQGGGQFRRYVGGPLGLLAAPRASIGGIPDIGFPQGIPSAGCIVFPYTPRGSGFFDGVNFEIDAPVQLLNAGPVLNFTGPLGARQLGHMGSLLYEGGGTGFGGFTEPAPAYLTPGDYTVNNGAGSADVGPFSAMLTIPSDPAAWTNQDAIGAIPRSQDLTVTWSGSGLVVIQGSSADPAAGVGAQFSCLAGDANKGTFTVPARVLSALPVSGLASDFSIPVGSLSVTSMLPSPSRFEARGIDIGYFNWGWVQIKNVNYQ